MLKFNIAYKYIVFNKSKLNHSFISISIDKWTIV